jgi:hypothetical protein
MDEEVPVPPTNNTGINTFSDLISEASKPAVEQPKVEEKPSVMISNPIGEVPSTPVFDTDKTPVSQVPEKPKELTGIVDPTNMTFESFMNSNGANINTSDEKPSTININQASNVSTFEAPVEPITSPLPTQVVTSNEVVQPVIENKQPQPVVINTTIKKPVQTQVQVDTGVNNVKVDTQSQVIQPSKDDDEFFDDFFE